MKLLVSANQAMKHSLDAAHSAWDASFFDADHAVVAVGYTSHNSLTYLSRLLELNPSRSLTLCIGLARFEGLTRSQREAAAGLDEKLRASDQGGVVVAHQIPFHGKVSVFERSGVGISAIIGSSNLGSLMPPRSDYESRSVEVDVEVNEPAVVNQLVKVLEVLVTDLSVPLASILPHIPAVPNQNRELESRTDVMIADAREHSAIYKRSSGIEFEIPLKDESKSNLNVYFGKGRANAQGHVRPRNWYEVELIVPKSVTDHKRYPRGSFLAWTDDGYLFACKTSGDNDKNFRSRDDLTVLGRWIKGRMESAECLRVGEPVTMDSLISYGRTSLQLTHTGEQRLFNGEMLEVWALDFSSER